MTKSKYVVVENFLNGQTESPFFCMKNDILKFSYSLSPYHYPQNLHIKLIQYINF